MEEENIPSNRDTATFLQKQVVAAAEKLQIEIKRLSENSYESSGNIDLYSSLIEEIEKIAKEAFSLDIISWLEDAAKNLEQAKKKANNHVSNKEILEYLQHANSLLDRARNIKG